MYIQVVRSGNVFNLTQPIKFSQRTQYLFEFATALASVYNGGTVEPEHLLLGMLLENDNNAILILQKLNIDIAMLQKNLLKKMAISISGFQPVEKKIFFMYYTVEEIVTIISNSFSDAIRFHCDSITTVIERVINPFGYTIKGGSIDGLDEPNYDPEEDYDTAEDYDTDEELDTPTENSEEMIKAMDEITNRITEKIMADPRMTEIRNWETPKVINIMGSGTVIVMGIADKTIGKVDAPWDEALDAALDADINP